MKIEESLINKFNAKINTLKDINREIEEDKDIDNAKYYLNVMLPELKNELKILNIYFIGDEIHESNVAYAKCIDREEPYWHQKYSELRDLLIRTETNLELFLENNK